LKIRKFREQTIKAELGEIVSQMNGVDDKIAQLSHHISQGYESQEMVLRDATTGGNIQFYPQYIEAHQANIILLQERKVVLEKEYQLKVAEMAIAMGDLKVVRKFKEKEYNDFKKDMQKLEMKNIDDMVIMRNIFNGVEG